MQCMYRGQNKQTKHKESTVSHVLKAKRRRHRKTGRDRQSHTPIEKEGLEVQPINKLTFHNMLACPNLFFFFFLPDINSSFVELFSWLLLVFQHSSQKV